MEEVNSRPDYHDEKRRRAVTFDPIEEILEKPGVNAYVRKLDAIKLEEDKPRLEHTLYPGEPYPLRPWIPKKEIEATC